VQQLAAQLSRLPDGGLAERDAERSVRPQDDPLELHAHGPLLIDRREVVPDVSERVQNLAGSYREVRVALADQEPEEAPLHVRSADLPAIAPEPSAAVVALLRRAPWPRSGRRRRRHGTIARRAHEHAAQEEWVRLRRLLSLRGLARAA